MQELIESAIAVKSSCSKILPLIRLIACSSECLGLGVGLGARDLTITHGYLTLAAL